jgi:hypothetical protein
VVHLREELGLPQEEPRVVLVLHLVGEDALDHHGPNERVHAAFGPRQVHHPLPALSQDLHGAISTQQELSEPVFSAH